MQVLVDPSWVKTSERAIILHQTYHHTCQFSSGLNQPFAFFAKNRQKATLPKFSGENPLFS
jgi:hypothetical protein